MLIFCTLSLIEAETNVQCVEITASVYNERQTMVTNANLGSHFYHAKNSNEAVLISMTFCLVKMQKFERNVSLKTEQQGPTSNE